MAIPKKNKGLGDVVESITKVTGIKEVVEFFNDGKECEPCKKKKEYLNSVKFFKKKIKLCRTFTENEYNSYKSFKEVRTLRITAEQTKLLCKLYSDIFCKPYWYPDCFSCSGTARSISNMIDSLDEVLETYKN